MPYKLDGNCVVKEDGSSVPGGCHKTHAEAVAHLRALYANVEDAKMLVEKAKPKTAVGDKLKIGDARHIADAITALGPGFRGHKVQLTPEERKTAVSNIRAAIAKLENEDLRKHLLERLAAVEHGKMIQISKSASGDLVWRGFVSVNTYDREDEVASSGALEGVVKTCKLLGFAPQVDFFHLEDRQYKAHFGPDAPPGITDWYDVVDGHLIAVGHWADDPVSKAWGQYVHEHPEGPDGSGWGMSWVFGSNPDESGVFKHISYAKRFTFLPYSQAAHPLSRFTTEERKMLTKEQEQAIALVKSDPVVKAAIQTLLEAESQSAGLDLIGVERKDVTTEAVTAADEQHKAEDMSKCPKCGSDMKDGKCTKCGYTEAAKSVKTEETPPKPAEAAEEKPAETAKAKTSPTPPNPQPRPGLQPSETRAALADRPIMFSDLKEVYKAVNGQIEAIVNERLTKFGDTFVADINKALQPRDQAVVELAKRFDDLSIVKEATLKETMYEKMVTAINEQNQKIAEVLDVTEEMKAIEDQFRKEYGTPRILEQWKAFAASDAPASVIDKSDPLSSAQPAVYADSAFSKVGLKPTNGRATAGQ